MKKFEEAANAAGYTVIYGEDMKAAYSLQTGAFYEFFIDEELFEVDTSFYFLGYGLRIENKEEAQLLLSLNYIVDGGERNATFRAIKNGEKQISPKKRVLVDLEEGTFNLEEWDYAHYECSSPDFNYWGKGRIYSDLKTKEIVLPANVSNVKQEELLPPIY